MSEVWIEDVDLADYGFYLGADPKQVASPVFSDATAPLIGSVGPMWLGEPVQAQPRRITIAGHVAGASASVYRGYVESLKALATLGAVRLRFSDHSDQEYRDARLVSFEAAPRAAILSNLAGDVTFTFEVADPFRYDVQPQCIPLTTNRASCPMGTAPVLPVIVAHGTGASLTNLVVTVRNASGDVVQTMTFTNTVGANDFRIIDSVKTAVTKSVAGTQSDALSEWTAGDFPVLRTADGGYEQSAWPTVELSSTTGAAAGVLTYSRAWL